MRSKLMTLTCSQACYFVLQHETTINWHVTCMISWVFQLLWLLGSFKHAIMEPLLDHCQHMKIVAVGRNREVHCLVKPLKGIWSRELILMHTPFLCRHRWAHHTG